MTDLANKTLSELKLICKERDIVGYSGFSRDELIYYMKLLILDTRCYGILRKFKNSSMLLCSYFIKYSSLKKTKEHNLDKTYGEYRDYVFDIKSKETCDFSIGDSDFKEFLVSFTFNKIDYGKKNKKMYPSKIFDATDTILCIQKNIRRKLIIINKGRFLNNESHIYYSRNIHSIVNIQKYYRSYLIRKNKCDSLRYISYLKNGYGLHPIGVKMLYDTHIEYDRNIIHIKLIVWINPYLRKNTIRGILNINVNNIRIMNNCKILSNNIKLDNNRNYYLIDKYDNSYTIDKNSLKITCKFPFIKYRFPFLATKYDIFSNISLLDRFKTKYNKIFRDFIFNKYQIKNVDIYNYRLLEDSCRINRNISDVVKSLSFSFMHNSLSDVELFHKSVRLSYVSLALGKICIYSEDNLSCDICYIIKKFLIKNPRFYQKGLQNKWNYTRDVYKTFSRKELMDVLEYKFRL